MCVNWVLVRMESERLSKHLKLMCHSVDRERMLSLEYYRLSRLSCGEMSLSSRYSISHSFIQYQYSIQLAKSRKIVDIVNRIKDAVVDERGKSLCRDIVEMTYAV